MFGGGKRRGSEGIGSFFRQLNHYIRTEILKGGLRLPPGLVRGDEDLVGLKVHLDAGLAGDVRR